MNIIYSEDVSKGGASFTIRKFFEKPPTMPQLVKWGTFSAKMAAYLWLCLEYGMSLFVSGETASGKTTTLNAMLSFINFKKKIYSAEDTPEVVVPHEVWQRLITRETVFDEAKVELFDLVKTALRSRPDYIIVGEVRGKEGSAAFQAMQTGHAVLSTFHASSIAKMIQRFTGDPINVPIRFIDNMNLALFQEIVYEEGRILRRCSAIEEIIKYSKEKGGILTRTIFEWDPVRDQHYFTGMYNSYILEHKIAPKMGLEFSKDIYTELERRERIIRGMVENGIIGYDAVNEVFKAYSERGWEGVPKEFRG
jgi:flagellar protein FlaI